MRDIVDTLQDYADATQEESVYLRARDEIIKLRKEVQDSKTIKLEDKKPIAWAYLNKFKGIPRFIIGDVTVERPQNIGNQLDSDDNYSRTVEIVALVAL